MVDPEKCPFGKNKGVRWVDMSESQLHFYASFYQELVNKKENKFSEQNKKSLKIIKDCISMHYDALNGDEYPEFDIF